MKKSVKKEVEKIIKKEKLNCSIEEFEDKVDWYWISRHQNISDAFRKEFQNKIDLEIEEELKREEDLEYEF